MSTVENCSAAVGAAAPRRRIWVVSELFYPEDTSTGHYMTRIAEGLASLACVKAICARPNYGRRGARVSRHEFHNEVEIFRSWGTALDRNITALRLVNIVTTTLGMFGEALWRLKSGDTVLVGTNPPALPFAIAVACWCKRSRFVLRLDDVYPDALVRAGLCRETSSLVSLMNMVNDWLYSRADRIITVGRDMAHLVATKSPSRQYPLEFIPNWGDVSDIFPCPKARANFRAQLGIERKFVVGYAGNLGPLQAIPHFFACIEKLRDEKDVHFVIVGTGQMFGWLNCAVQAAEQRNVTVLGSRPRSEQHAFLNGFDLGVVCLVKGMAGVGVPSRTYNLLAAGKPILTSLDVDSEIATTVREENVGWVTCPGDVDGFVAAVLEAKARPDLLAEMGMRARRVAESRFAAEVILNQYRAVFA